MKNDTSNLRGRCQYVMDRNESARLNWYTCARLVWVTFYGHLFFDDPERGRMISILEIHQIPTPAAIRKEWRSILGVERPVRETPRAIPYYVEMS